jgi:mannosyltransferase OCH1-like enzyme
MIPKVFHRIWLGGSMPEEFIHYGETWKAHNPGWTLKLWTEENLTTRYPDLVKRCWKYRHESNIYRYELLLREGGIYIDTDFECLRPIGPLIEGMDAFSAYQLDEPSLEGAIAPGLFGTVPGAPFMNDLVEHIPDAFSETHWLNCGPPYFTSIVRRHPEVHIFPRLHFYPYLWDELERKAEVFDHAYAVHHWSSKARPELDSRKQH